VEGATRIRKILSKGMAIVVEENNLRPEAGGICILESPFEGVSRNEFQQE
jgi:hypothetical protein